MLLQEMQVILQVFQLVQNCASHEAPMDGGLLVMRKVNTRGGPQHRKKFWNVTLIFDQLFLGPIGF